MLLTDIDTVGSPVFPGAADRAAQTRDRPLDTSTTNRAVNSLRVGARIYILTSVCYNTAPDHACRSKHERSPNRM